jgi:calcineurin-like phosphoesterase family protein
MLNGKIHLILGNHDKAIKGALKDSFESVSSYSEITIQDPELDTKKCRIIMFHYPIERWCAKHFGAIHVHGHSHGTCPTPRGMARIDVGVDNFNYYPVSYNAIKAIFTQQMMETKAQ